MSQEKFAAALQKKKSARHLFNPVITPENIPQFTIPSLSILESNRMFPAKKSFAWRSHQWHSEDDRFLNQTSRRRCSDPVCKNTHGLSSVSFDDLPDPVSRAAMSLPHLPKIYTPYGFLTLGKSPHVVIKESFFFQTETSIGMKPKEICHSLQNSLISEITEKNDYIQLIPKAQNICHVLQYPVNTAQTSTGTPIQKLRDSQKLMSRRTSIPVINSRNYHQVSKSEWITQFRSQRSNSLPKITTRRSSQNLFQCVLTKHLNNLEQFKFSSAELEENYET